ncbi:MAG: T9SS type A sorting domain-containing protein, partial [Crocinitomicaceae bacterium]|nr:T9SS type A sorting domain-containing protein [Crocinitomicaceae bacterium]
YYPEMEQTSSIGRFPNGSGDFTEMRPTFHEKNTDPADGNYLTEQLFVYPNPANNSINVRYNGLEDGVIYIYSLDGRSIVAQASINAESVLTINTSSFEDGFYMVKTVFENAQLTQKIVITH